MLRVIPIVVLVVVGCGPSGGGEQDAWEEDGGEDAGEEEAEEPQASLLDFEECGSGCAEGLVCAMGRCLDPDDEWWAFAPPDAETSSRIFEAFWGGLGAAFPRFGEIAVDWDVAREPWRERVTAAEDLGSFFGELSNMTYLLRDSHVTLLSPAMESHPAAVGLDFRASGMGVCTTLDDLDRIVVYRAWEGDMAPGDVIELVDGLAWREKRAELEGGYVYGMNPHEVEALDHVWAASLLRYARTVTVRRLDGSSFEAEAGGVVTYACTLRPVGLIDEETTYGELAASYGSDTGSVIVSVLGSGIVYAALRWEGGETTTSADLAALLADHATSPGIVIDMRMNLGGNLYAAYPVWEAMLTSDVSPAIEWAARLDDVDREALGVAEVRDMTAGAGHYGGRVAVLTGPAAVSAGDCTAWMLSRAGARRFGIRTDGSCSSPFGMWTLDAGPYEAAASFRAPVWVARDPVDHAAVAGDKLEPEERVWWSAEDLGAGTDTVLEAAISWILSG